MRTFLTRKDGSVAVEFALIAPVLIALYAGVFQISMLIMQDRDVSHSASVMGDLATQTPKLDKAGVEDVMQAAIEVLDISNSAVWSNGDVSMQLVSLERPDMDAPPNIIGSATVGSGFDDVTTWTIDERLLSPTSGAVVARIRYDFKLISHGTDTKGDEDNLIGGSILLKEDFILKPRLSTSVLFEAADGTNGATFDCSISNEGKISC